MDPWPGGHSHSFLDPRPPNSQPIVLVERPNPEGGHCGPDTFSGNWILLSAGGAIRRLPRALPAGPGSCEIREMWLDE